jgi:hypothetical protein
VGEPRAGPPARPSWLNQIEVYFSILGRNALTPCHFADLDELERRVLGFQAEFAETAGPFDCSFTRRHLNARGGAGRLTELA